MKILIGVPLVACLSLISCGSSSSSQTGTWTPPAGCTNTGTCSSNADCTTAGPSCVFESATSCKGTCVAVSDTSSSCGGSNGVDTCDEYVTTSQKVGGCPAQPAKLTGTASTGAACSTAQDCAPTCCDCGDAGVPLLAAECTNGKCAGADVACADTKTSCGN